MDGHAFCEGVYLVDQHISGLFNEAQRIMLDTSTFLIRKVTMLKTREMDDYSSLHGISYHSYDSADYLGMAEGPLLSSLDVQPLGQLLDMYRFRQATKPHDKVFALLGMSSDACVYEDPFQDYRTP